MSRDLPNTTGRAATKQHCQLKWSRGWKTQICKKKKAQISTQKYQYVLMQTDKSWGGGKYRNDTHELYSL